jgi:hypothetical protein
MIFIGMGMGAKKSLTREKMDKMIIDCIKRYLYQFAWSGWHMCFLVENVGSIN